MTDPRIALEEVRDRLDRTLRLTAQRGLDGLVVIGRAFYDRPGDLAYLTNHFPPFPASVFSGVHRGLGHGLLLLPLRGAPALIVDSWAYRKDMMVIEDIRADSDLGRGLVGALRERGLATARIGLVGEDILPLSLYREVTGALPGLVVEPADDLVRSQRTIKSAAEQALLRRSAEVAHAGLRTAVEHIHEGVRESAVCASGIGAAMAEGADFVRYLRVHSGPESASGSRWPQATSRTLERGDLVTLDIIGAVRGYQFDVLRTTVVGAPDPEQRRLLEAVAQATDAAVAEARPGAVCGDLVRLANGLLERAGYGNHTRNFIGHGIGLETVEEPYLTAEITMRLQPGMVLCIEPGVYIPGWGGASIEQEVIVTEGEPEVITHTPARLW